jgi:hypothetical protein
METLLILVGTIFILPLLILYSSFSWGYVATVLSNWFIIPLFPEFPQFTWIEYSGIMFFIDCFIHLPKTQVKDEYIDKTSQWVKLILSPWIVLFGAWILHLIY